MYKLKITLQGLPKTYNVTGRTHWAIKANEAKRWRKEVAYSVISHRPKMPLTKAKVTLTRRSATQCDFDNLVQSFKNVLDGLVDGKIIVDDAPCIIGYPTYVWEKAKRGDGSIVIEVEEDCL